MRLEKTLGHWVIAQGKGRRVSYFSFFVDDDSSSWTAKRPWDAQQFNSHKKAMETLVELGRRSALKRRRSLERKRPGAA